MSDPTRPIAVATELRRSVQADATELPVLSTTGFRTDARKLVGEEYVACGGAGLDATGWPVLTSCTRGVAREDGGSEARPWPAGTSVEEVGWTAVDIYDEIPTPTVDMAGRQFAYRDGAGNIYTFNVALYQDGTAYIDWVNEPPGGMEFVWESAITGLTFINGVAVDSGGNIYVSFRFAPLDYRIRKYTGAYAQTWDTGSVFAPNELTHLATNGTDLFVSRAANNVIAKRLCSTGAAGSPATFGSAGAGNGQFSAPIGIITDGAAVWVVDRNNNRVQKFDTAGTYQSQFGTAGTADGQFNAPTGIALSGGSLYVLDAGNARIQKFNAATHAHQLTTDLGRGNADGQINAIVEGIAVDSQGRIWIADTGNHRIQVFDGAGVFLAAFGSFGSGDGQFKYPRQIAFGANDLLYVADASNNRLVTVRERIGITPTVTVRSNSTTVASGNDGTVTASCNAGEVCVGGGGTVATQTSNAPLNISRPNPTSGTPTGWVAGVSNASGSGKTLTAYAICLVSPIV